MLWLRETACLIVDAATIGTAGIATATREAVPLPSRGTKLRNRNVPAPHALLGAPLHTLHMITVRIGAKNMAEQSLEITIGRIVLPCRLMFAHLACHVPSKAAQHSTSVCNNQPNSTLMPPNQNPTPIDERPYHMTPWRPLQLLAIGTQGHFFVLIGCLWVADVLVSMRPGAKH